MDNKQNIEKLDMSTPNITDDNVARIAELFPNVVTEGRDENGKLTHVIDFDALKQELSDSIVEGPQERYRLDWPGKREAMLAANTPITKTLRPVREESVDFDTTKNLFIEGDNLIALKLLQENYLGKVKCIYIDPPYNTGNDFVYRDNFSLDHDEHLNSSGEMDEIGNRMVSNPETDGRHHSNWLSMILSRLRLSRNLMKEDGVIFISIDDWELGNLKRVCDEVFGPRNFIGIFCRKTKSGGGSASDSCAVEHDYVVVYGKNNSEAAALITKFDAEYLKRYKLEDHIGPYFWDTMERSSTATKPYLIEAPDGSMLSGKWFRSEQTFLKDKEKGEVRFLEKEGTWSVQFKQRLSDGKKFRTILETQDLTDKKFRSLNKEVEELVGCGLGHPPKPVSLIETLIYSVIPKADEPEIVMDFFAGTGTTAHAAIRLNEKDLGKRKFILVQIAEKTYQLSNGEKVPNKHYPQVFEAGYDTVAELTKDRIRRAGKKILKDNPDQVGKLDVGFRVLKIDSSNMNDVYYAPSELDQVSLLDAVEHIKPDRTSEDLLFQVMLDWGVDLSLPIVREQIDGKTVFWVGDDDLVACFDLNISEDIVKAMAERKPLRAVFRDDGFGSDDMKINAGQLFAQMTDGHTDMKVI